MNAGHAFQTPCTDYPGSSSGAEHGRKAAKPGPCKRLGSKGLAALVPNLRGADKNRTSHSTGSQVKAGRQLLPLQHRGYCTLCLDMSGMQLGRAKSANVKSVPH